MSGGKQVGAEGLAGAAVAALVTAATAAAYAISFAAIVYSGDALGEFLAQGIGLALLGAAAMGAVGAFFYSYRGTICQPQDVTAILLANSAAAIAVSGTVAEDQLFATVAVFLAVTSIATGALVYVLGRRRIGILARFVPYPVVAGYMAASGYLLLEAATAFALGQPVNELSAAALAAEPEKWLPWLAVGGALLILAKQWDKDLVLPFGLIFLAVGFYLALELTGQNLTEAREYGYLLGPLEAKTLLPTQWPMMALDADWLAIFWQTPMILGVAALTVLGTLLSSTGIETHLRSDFDLGKDLQATGRANIVGGVFGGMAGHQLLSETVLANRLGLTGAFAGLSATAGCLIFLAVGLNVLELIPLGIFATIIAYLGADLLYDWLLRPRVKLSLPEFLVVLAIVAMAAVGSFLAALILGACLAALIFVWSYARSEIIRVRSTAASSRSLVERNQAEIQYLSEVGDSAVVLQLSGFLFFGTAHRLAQQVRRETDKSNDIDTLILDFSRVDGLDASALSSLTKISQICDNQDVRLVLCGMSNELATRLRAAPEVEDEAEIRESLALALEDYETRALSNPNAPKGGDAQELIDAFVDAARAGGAVVQESFGAGDVFVEQGAETREIFLLVGGAVRAEIAGTGGEPRLVARFQPGALLGEIAYFADLARTANLVADGDCVVVRIDPEALEATRPELLAMLHKYAAALMARRLMRTTRLLYEAGL